MDLRILIKFGTTCLFIILAVAFTIDPAEAAPQAGETLNQERCPPPGNPGQTPGNCKPTTTTPKPTKAPCTPPPNGCSTPAPGSTRPPTGCLPVCGASGGHGTLPGCINCLWKCIKPFKELDLPPTTASSLDATKQHEEVQRFGLVFGCIKNCRANSCPIR